MIEPLVLKGVLALLSGMANSVMDLLKDKHSTSIFKKHLTGFWADAYSVSWKNKYKLGDPRYGRKKFLGIVIPVWILDGWHFSKLIVLVAGGVAVALPTAFLHWHWNFLYCGSLFFVGFWVGYQHLFLRK